MARLTGYALWLTDLAVVSLAVAFHTLAVHILEQSERR